ncbi:MAG: hypothetical protein H0X63_00070 [Flavobacteriales bacterium]|nr:hypothetical protein [Flavobacteriales bacterium]
MKSSIEEIYYKLLNEDGGVRYNRLNRWLPSQFKFEYSNKFSLPFWIERGYSQMEYDCYTKDIFETRKSTLSSHRKEIKSKSLIYDPEYSILFKYKTTLFECKEIPKCNTCGYELTINKSSYFEQPIYKIKSCSNLTCLSNVSKLEKDIKWISYLPKDRYEELKNNLKSVKRSFSKEFWIGKGLSEEEAIKKVFEIQSSNSKKFTGKRTGKSKEMLRKKGYSEEQIAEVSLSPSQIDFWIKKGHTEEEAMLIISKNQINASSFVDFEKRLLPSNCEYWENKGYSTDESILKVKKSQTTFSKEICIQKYGEVEGLIIFNNRTKKWQNSLLKNGNIKGGYSKISQELFIALADSMNIYNDCKFALNNSELALSESNKNYYYDFTYVNDKKIIEYNGDQYHANPLKYAPDDFPHPYRKSKGYSSKDIWEYDSKKTSLANKNGYDVLVIWDSEYKNNKKEILQKCINFLTNK